MLNPQLPEGRNRRTASSHELLLTPQHAAPNRRRDVLLAGFAISDGMDRLHDAFGQQIAAVHGVGSIPSAARRS